ncbi:hypothetical protein [Ornithinimicrobium tianjinense]|uniref:Uncharacterized protein n=1 Tax=Ornithinimicrobium tianjinense TaxID=1195761 RepID=A0A917BI25_9MICO|nr:hypothetical protein [Ornithinimicrobium tianjinense]GGF42405.1 hypothetical protein GCM10011366_07770 [Ornithinimicrobium tianjinense]
MSRGLRSALPLAVGTLLLGALLFYVGSLPHGPAAVTALVVVASVVAPLLLGALTREGRYAERAYWASTLHQEAVPPAAMDYRLVRIRRDLRDAVERDDREDLVHPLLRELAAERLLAHHGVDLDADPEAARRVVDPLLWRYLTTPPTDARKRSRSALQTAIEGIEKL